VATGLTKENIHAGPNVAPDNFILRLSLFALAA
jgi:hypothetical protein